MAVYKLNWVVQYIVIGIDPTLQTYGIRLYVSSGNRIIVPEIVIVMPRFGIIVLAGETQIVNQIARRLAVIGLCFFLMHIQEWIIIDLIVGSCKNLKSDANSF